MENKRNIYMLTSEGWQHLETGRVVESGGILLDAADIQRLKELHLESEKEGEDTESDKSHGGDRSNVPNGTLKTTTL